MFVFLFMCRPWHQFRNIFVLAQDPKERLGCHPQTGFADIQGHPFFRNVDWDLVREYLLA